jgi:hypothetical protein
MGACLSGTRLMFIWTCSRFDCAKTRTNKVSLLSKFWDGVECFPDEVSLSELFGPVQVMREPA